MKKIIISVFFLLFFSSASFADVISGKVRQDDKLYARNQVVDSKDGSPVDNAKVSIRL